MSLINNEQQTSGSGAANNTNTANQRNSISIPSKNSGGIFQTHNNNTRGFVAPVANSRTLDNSSTIFG